MAQLLHGLFTLQCIYMVSVNMQSDKRDPLRIGVTLDEKSERQQIFTFAWDYYREQLGITNAKYDPIDVIDVSDNHKLITSMCNKMSEGAIMMLVDNHPQSYSSVQSYAHYLNVPTLVPGGSGNNIYNPYTFDISLLPSTIDAIVAVIKHFHWNSVVYYLWDTNDGLLRLQKLYESFSSGDFTNPTIRARRITNISDCYEILRKIDHEGPTIRMKNSPNTINPKRVILDLSSRAAYESVLHQIVDVGMNREGYHYILGGLGIDELDLSTFVYGGVNITGFSIIDNLTNDNVKLMRRARNYPIHNVGKITCSAGVNTAEVKVPEAATTYSMENSNCYQRLYVLTLTENALIIDSVQVILRAVQSLTDDLLDQKTLSRRNRIGHTISDSSTDCCNCSSSYLYPRFDGEYVLKALKNVQTYGLTGNIDFDENGMRQRYYFRVYQLEHKKPLRDVGHWIPGQGLNISIPRSVTPVHPFDVLNRTLRIVTLRVQPFMEVKKTMDNTGFPMIAGKYYEGYIVDLAKKLQRSSQTHFEYYLDLVGDKNYGNSDPLNGCWDGMIGELIDTHGCDGKPRKKADIALAPLTITRERQRVVDFTKPYMLTGISIMIKKPDKEKPGVFSFMYPLSNLVWTCVMVAFVTVSLVLFCVGRWSPYEWSDVGAKGGSPVNHLTLINTFWFSLGALLRQGADTFPRSISGRVVGSAWWFFTLILISSYTANLAAFLTIERLTPPISSVDELVAQTKIDYGTLSKGSSRGFFEESRVDVYRRMWQFMSANFDRVMVNSTDAGVEKVRSSKGTYAFLLESAMNNYHNQRKPCNTMKVGSNLDSKGYGIATPLNFYLRSPLNLAVLQLRETGELMKLEMKWWYDKGECGTDDAKDATTSALTLSNVSGIFHILVGGLVLSMVVALLEYVIHQRIRSYKRRTRAEKMKPQTVRIVKKQTLEALKEVGYSERENTTYYDYSNPGPTAASPLMTFESGATYNNGDRGTTFNYGDPFTH